jgi:hypothetical protein
MLGHFSENIDASARKSSKRSSNEHTTSQYMLTNMLQRELKLYHDMCTKGRLKIETRACRVVRNPVGLLGLFSATRQRTDRQTEQTKTIQVWRKPERIPE